MVKGEALSLISAGEQPRPPTAMQIFGEAAKLLWRSRKPMLAILLILLLLQALLFLGSVLIVNPLIQDMSIKFVAMDTKQPMNPEYHELLAAAMNDLRELAGVQLATLLISFLSSAFFVMAAVQTVAMAGKGEQATLKGLLCRIRRTWKGPVATLLYVVVIYFGAYTALFFPIVAAFACIFHGSVVVLALGAVTAAAAVLAALLLLVYLRMVWLQGLVVSVVEDGCYGLAALGRAAELIHGRRRLGFKLSLLLSLLTFTVFLVYCFVNTQIPPRGTIHLAGGLVAVCAGLLMSAFALAVDVVFYYECKRSHGEEVSMKGSLVYSRLPTAATVDGDLP